jgi:hypothetical protein
MFIGLHDAEFDHMPQKTFPNLALMKLSAYHKAKGDSVEWWLPINNPYYDKVYSSKVFDFTPTNEYLPEHTIRGGTGYDVKTKLPEEVDDMFPDYSIYPNCDYAIGYITRGCPNSCTWCVVPEKEGSIKPYRPWYDIARRDSKKIVLMDNNILANDFGIEQLSNMIDSGYSIDLNQGMDARLVTSDVAKVLSQLSWIKYLRFSCDNFSRIADVITAIEMLLSYGVKAYSIFIYFLVTKDIEDAVHRIEEFKKYPWCKSITLFAQAERNDRKGIIPNKVQIEFATRYVYGGSWRKENFYDYCEKRKLDFLFQSSC